MFGQRVGRPPVEQAQLPAGSQPMRRTGNGPSQPRSKAAGWLFQIRDRSNRQPRSYPDSESGQAQTSAYPMTVRRSQQDYFLSGGERSDGGKNSILENLCWNCHVHAPEQIGSQAELIEALAEVERLKEENERLKKLLGIRTNVPGIIPIPTVLSPASVTTKSSTQDKIRLFRSLFRGRDDLYAVRWEGKNGKSGYSPACIRDSRNFFCLEGRGRQTTPIVAVNRSGYSRSSERKTDRRNLSPAES